LANCAERFSENHLGAPMSDALGEPSTWECLLSSLRKLRYFRRSLRFMAHLLFIETLKIILTQKECVFFLHVVFKGVKIDYSLYSQRMFLVFLDVILARRLVHC
jgi:hypothetical protein